MHLSHTDLVILCIRVAALVPLLAFLVSQMQHRFQNGITKLVRRMTFYLVLAQLLLILNLITLRIVLVSTGDPRNFGMNAVTILVAIVQIVSTVYAWKVFREIHRDDHT
jgi:hypothetical protein